MPLFFSSINSGSNGNCYYIGNNDEGVLIDAGISCRETEKRMKKLGLDMQKVKAIFVSHEHSDHITGIPGISKKYQLPVYITDQTFSNSNIPVEQHLIRSFAPYQPICVGSISVLPFPKSHDAADPHSFMISQNNMHIGVFTDIGYACKHVIKHFTQCHAAFLESNYCDDMLEKGNYPESLKRRIRSKEGHLSNSQALGLFLTHRGKQLSHLVLSHLSRNNNSMQLVEDTFSPHAGNTKMIIASRYKETEVFCIDEKNTLSVATNKKSRSHQQLTLF
ncbi:MAG TPA: MBL fold metallo-hydrolase [Puia sp.]|nr:MBL fold metallo-hydrolase [Puia sp.]